MLLYIVSREKFYSCFSVQFMFVLYVSLCVIYCNSRWVVGWKFIIIIITYYWLMKYLWHCKQARAKQSVSDVIQAQLS